MKLSELSSRKRFLLRLGSVLIALASAADARAQGTVNFNGAALYSGTDYYEGGMWFHTVIPPGEYYHDGMAGLPAILGPANVPYNATPYMIFLRQNSPDDYVTLSLSSGSPFGLTSVQLADPTSPSLTALPITFKGFKADGSTISQTFTTAGNNATALLPYTFNAVFASGLTSVEIDATRWAMDDLVFTVPEPNCVVLLGIGLSALVLRKKSSH